MHLVTRLPEPVNILLVDDQQRNLDALALVLDQPGYNIVKVTSGMAAIHELLRTDFAVVLLDVMMPILDGFATAKRMRDCDSCCGTPIIFVSAVADEMDFVFRGYASGAVDYIIKPIQPAVVKAKVAVFVELFRAQRVLKEQLAEAQELCRRLEKEKDDERRSKEELVAQVRAFATTFERRVLPGSDAVDLQLPG